MIVAREHVLYLGRAKNKILHAVEEAIIRKKLRANPPQSKQQQQNHAMVSGTALADPEGFGHVCLIAAPGGSREGFFKADKAHKAPLNLAKWFINPKNKDKDAVTPIATPLQCGRP